MKFKEGEKARVKSFDKLVKEFGVPVPASCFTYAKRQYCDRVVTIAKVYENGYLIKEDNRWAYWTDEMLEPINCPNAKYILVKLRNDKFDGTLITDESGKYQFDTISETEELANTYQEKYNFNVSNLRIIKVSDEYKVSIKAIKES